MVVAQLIGVHNSAGSCPSPAINFWGKGPPFRLTIGLTCVLSVLGAILIISSYVFFKSLRSSARWILVHLSLMDLGVGLTNLIGNIVYFDRFYFSDAGNGSCPVFHQPKDVVVKNLCVAQAFLAHYFTQASVLWTISLAVFLYFLIVHHRTPVAMYSLRFSYVLCYGLPVIICIWLVFTNRFGYSPNNTGWCSILQLNSKTLAPDIFAVVVGYDLWVYLAIVVVPIIYLAVQLFLREKVSASGAFERGRVFVDKPLGRGGAFVD